MCACAHTNVTSQTVIYPNPNPNQKKISNLRPETLTFFVRVVTAHRDGGGRALQKGLGFLDSSLYLTQYSVINEPARGPVRRFFLHITCSANLIKTSNNYVQQEVDEKEKINIKFVMMNMQQLPLRKK